eukprot:3664609-Amphidinium_carterae.1
MDGVFVGWPSNEIRGAVLSTSQHQRTHAGLRDRITVFCWTQSSDLAFFSGYEKGRGTEVPP